MIHIGHNLKVVKRRIMFRVWLSYLIGLANLSAFAGLVFGSSVVLLFRIVSVPSILTNLLEVRLGAVPQYIWHVFAKIFINGEFLKLITVFLIVSSLMYLYLSLRHSSFSNHFVQNELRYKI